MSSAPAPATSAATPSGERIQALDLLRGAALFGVCAVNLLHFALPSDQAVAVPIGGSAGEVTAWALVNGLLTGKSFTLFSLLFGMGFALQRERAERADRPFVPVYRRRLVTLGGIGLAHGVLLFFGDILFVYSLAGGILLWTRKASVPRLWRLAKVFLGVGAGLSLLLYATVDMAASDPEWAARELAAYAEGGWARTLRINAEGYVGWLFVSTLIWFNWLVMACFFAGAALQRSGFVHARNGPLHRKLMRRGLAAGLPLQGAALALQYHAPDLSVVGAGLDLVSNLALTAAWLGGLVAFAHSGALPRLARAIACTGRMALTHYLGQSLIACFLFRWYGLDLFAELSRLQLVGVALAVYSGQALFSVLWLARFPMGPLEWLWRRATYRRTLP